MICLEFKKQIEEELENINLVWSLERKLEALYAQGKKLFNKVAKDGNSKSLTNLIEDNNNKIDELFKTTDQKIASKLKNILKNSLKQDYSHLD